MMADLAGLNPTIAAMIAGLQERFPQVRITSGFRDPARNAAVGGARNSQHLEGNAFDFSVRGIPEDQQRAVLQYLREQGATGFGYYPNSQSVHADIGPARFWGPDKTRASLGQTPAFFQEFAGAQPTTQVATAAPAAATGAATAPTIYSPDPLTSLQRIGNTFAPSRVSAPTPLTEAQIKEMSLLGGQNSLLGGNLGNMGLALLQQQERIRQAKSTEEDLGPGIQQGRFTPIRFSRGLL